MSFEIVFTYSVMSFLFVFLFIMKRDDYGPRYSPLRKQNETGAEIVAKCMVTALLWPVITLVYVGKFLVCVGKWLRETPEYYE